jgi:hypothetical protein
MQYKNGFFPGNEINTSMIDRSKTLQRNNRNLVVQQVFTIQKQKYSKRRLT